jgi:hypothetical protein
LSIGGYNLKKSLLLLAIISVLIVPLLSLGCLAKPAPSTPIPTVNQQDTTNKQLQDNINAVGKQIGTLPSGVPDVVTYINTGLAGKANAADLTTTNNNLNTTNSNLATTNTNLNNLTTKVNNLPQGQSTDLSNYYTKAQVDAAVKKAIDDYKASIASNPTPTPSGQLTFTPTTFTNIYSNNPQGQTVTFTLNVVNSSNTWHYIKPNFSFTVNTQGGGGAVTASSANITVSSSGATIAYGGGYFPPLPTATNILSFNAFPTGGTNVNPSYFDLAVGPGQSIPLLVSIRIDTNLPSIWNCLITMSDRVQ